MLSKQDGASMGNRVYLLLNVTAGKSEEALCALRGKSGVVVADLLEDQLGILVMLQATNRPKLARLAVDLISAIEQITENVSLLPVSIQSDKVLMSPCI
jgi:hypothetical protein